MRINLRLALDLFVLGVVCIAAYYTFFHGNSINQAVLKSVTGRAVGEAVEGQFTPFQFSFRKAREDCHSPKITRRLVDMNTGVSMVVHDNLDAVVQYPVTAVGSMSKIQLEIGIPEDTATTRAVVLSEICYTCPVLGLDLGDRYRERQVCRSFSTNEFRIEEKGHDEDRGDIQPEVPRSGAKQPM